MNNKNENENYLESIDDIIDIIPLDKSTNLLANLIINEDDVNNTKALLAKFNLNIVKKNAIRIIKLNSLLDKVSDLMIERFEKRPDEFNNQDLLNYMQVTLNTIEKALKNIVDLNKAPEIVVNQQNNVVNVSNDVPVLDRDSRERVSNAIQAILAKINNKTDIISDDIDNNELEVIVSGNEK